MTPLPDETLHDAAAIVRELGFSIVTGVDPANPAADANGYVQMPNVDPVQEMVNMISASRSYQANVETLNTAKQLMLKTLTIGS